MAFKRSRVQVPYAPLEYLGVEVPYAPLISGHLAQLGAHFLDVEGVRGSSPLVPITKQDAERCPVLLCSGNKGLEPGESERSERKEKVRWTFDADAA